MKGLSFLMAFGAASLFAASPVALHLGENATPTGEVLAFEAVTASNAPTVKVSRIVSVRETTNAVARSIEPHVRYDFGLTNWNGSAYVATNVYDRFRWGDWEVNGTNHVVGLTSTNVVVTNTYTIAVPGKTYEVTNALFNATASGHYLMATNATMKFLSGAGYLLVEGASADDRLTLFIK